MAHALIARWMIWLADETPEPPPSLLGISRPLCEVDYASEVADERTLHEQLIHLETLRQRRAA